MRDVTGGVTRDVTRESLDLHHTTPHLLVVTSVFKLVGHLAFPSYVARRTAMR
jgi:hypothetical protein